MIALAAAVLLQTVYPPTVTPPTCDTAPVADTYGGSAGSAAACIPRADAARPTQVQPAATTTAADGSWSVSWPTLFASAPTTVVATMQSGSTPFICQTAMKSATGASGKCWQIVASTLPTAVAALPNLVISPIANPAAGLPIMIVGRQ